MVNTKFFFASIHGTYVRIIILKIFKYIFFCIFRISWQWWCVEVKNSSQCSALIFLCLGPPDPGRWSAGVRSLVVERPLSSRAMVMLWGWPRLLAMLSPAVIWVFILIWNHATTKVPHQLFISSLDWIFLTTEYVSGSRTAQGRDYQVHRGERRISLRLWSSSLLRLEEWTK